MRFVFNIEKFAENVGEALGKFAARVPMTILGLQLAAWMEWPQMWDLPSPSLKQSFGIALLIYLAS